MSKEKQNTPTHTPTQNQFTNSELKQIEEMAKVMCGGCANGKECMQCFCADWYRAEKLYDAGYRKQSEGEWIKHKRFYASGKTLIHYQCNLCGVYLATQANFCPNCGAKMKGGAE